MRLHKKLTTFIILLAVLLTVIPSVEAFDVSLESAILIEAETGQHLFEKNINEKLPPASITKIMTLLIAMEKIEEGTISLDDEVTISRFAESMGGSQIFLAANTRVKMSDLLKAVTIASANDASVAVGEAIAGTYSNFISMMNEKAKQLGMDDTNFVNSTGLPDPSGEHYSTAEDISIMARELVKYDQVLEWASIWVDHIQLPNREAMLVNTNKLIKSYPSMDGLKTGHTDEAGYCLVATAKKGDSRLISVVLKGESQLEREEATIRLLDYGFNSFSKKQMAKKGDKIQNIRLPGGAKKVIEGEVAENFYVMIQKGQENSLHQEVKVDELTAPVNKGEKIGTLTVYQNDNIIGEVDVIAAETVKRANFIVRSWRGLIGFITGFFN
ncbi:MULTISPECIES: D-alanyl-D-alanine carboxypeptidase family protein [unclassified Halanaerobium]|uniref:D-alanyl-D-alanine carboxypeptidase family protein n=1 Tax=unclassified Halanaerobium TaxID=2641197 RepID=UPI000DF49B63|nr:MULTISPECIES: D-alanyl-D-alanine carboxypeptidase family protein [unclassified Halanaerobium]RCW40878.1 D-alanyl-D-alanine carboxypeptidase (penicillin-binding protein 5/6) [Halanaerobium sp. MA284_MarDTE_T2]RCW79079.1 D-alanyl-D-alanine carboxypeptidase (penicillin-binding protein 5/6) [Halanaerobium sp. DL-01]